MENTIFIVIAILIAVGIVKKIYGLIKLAAIITIAVFAARIILPYLAG